jgi:benzaldehyde dehydrogenase (NAD)
VTGPALLNHDIWSGQIYLEGTWRSGSARLREVVEPATGRALGVAGIANAADVRDAAGAAARAQADWAALPHTRRAGVLRKAGQLFAEHAGELSWWNIREVGAVPSMAGFALHVAEQECYEAAALPSHPYGDLLPSEEPRLSMNSRMPAGVVGVISPFNVPDTAAQRPRVPTSPKPCAVA